MSGPLLKQGDRIALIAPARFVTPADIAPFITWAESHNLTVYPGKHLFGALNQFSGTDAERAADFISAWTNPEIKAIFCARGGYGTMRFLEHVPENLFKQAGKVLCGYSDITTLHLALNKAGVQTVHSPMAVNFQSNSFENRENIRHLEQLLFNGKIELNVSEILSVNLKPFSGNIIGGNLSLVYASLGTPEQPETEGKILFLEDLDEYLYHIDRMIVSLDRAGIFRNLNGLIIGSMSEMKDNTVPFGSTAEKIIAQRVAHYGFPVIFNFPAGHGPKNFAFKLGAFTTFDGYNFKQP